MCELRWVQERLAEQRRVDALYPPPNIRSDEDVDDELEQNAEMVVDATRMLLKRAREEEEETREEDEETKRRAKRSRRV